MKDSDTLLRRAEKLRRDALAVRKEALRLTLESDRECMVKVVAALEAGARALEKRAGCPLRTFDRGTHGGDVQSSRQSGEGRYRKYVRRSNPSKRHSLA